MLAVSRTKMMIHRNEVFVVQVCPVSKKACLLIELERPCRGQFPNCSPLQAKNSLTSSCASRDESSPTLLIYKRAPKSEAFVLHKFTGSSMEMFFRLTAFF